MHSSSSQNTSNRISQHKKSASQNPIFHDAFHRIVISSYYLQHYFFCTFYKENEELIPFHEMKKSRVRGLFLIAFLLVAVALGVSIPHIPKRKNDSDDDDENSARQQTNVTTDTLVHGKSGDDDAVVVFAACSSEGCGSIDANGNCAAYKSSGCPAHASRPWVMRKNVDNTIYHVSSMNTLSDAKNDVRYNAAKHLQRSVGAQARERLDNTFMRF